MSAKVAPRVISQYGESAKPVGGSRFETFSWYFFRWSGIGLIFLVIIHLVIMHVTNDVSKTTYDFVAARYDNPFWRVYDLLLLTLGLLHGLNGLRVMVDDYVRSRTWRLVAQSVVALTAVTFWLMGAMTIVTFHKDQTALQSVLTLLHH
jgi:succinate dehydrogenase / fumarate reductase, membrane anchor subunit